MPIRFARRVLAVAQGAGAHRLRAVGTRSFSPGSYGNGGGLADDAPTWQRGRIFVKALPVDLVAVAVEFANWSLSPLKPPVPGDNTICVAAKVFFIKQRRYEMLSFDRQWHGRVEPGRNLRSDIGRLIVPAGTEFAIETLVWPENSAHGTWPQSLAPVGGRYDYAWNGSANYEPNFNGEVDKETLKLSGNGRFGPLGIYGIPAGPLPAIGILADSQGFGIGDSETGDGPFNGDGDENRGPYQRACAEAGIGMVKICRAGILVRDFAQSDMNYLSPLATCTTVLVQGGTNDLSHHVSVADTTQNLLALWTAAAAQSGRPVIACTIPPRTRSTNRWASIEDQSPFSEDFLRDRRALNAFIKSAPEQMPRLVRGVIDGGEAVAAEGAPDLWRPGATSDGVHWNGAVGIPIVQARTKHAIDTGLID